MDQLSNKLIQASYTVMTEMVMPNDTNAFGNLMGGNLMKWMDIAGAICAARHSENYVVTASVDNVSFEHPIKLGDIITLQAKVTRAFNTSLEIFIEVYVNDVKNKVNKKCNHAYLTFVALDAITLKPTPVPQVELETENEKQLFEGALRRRQVRLVIAGRMKPSEALDLKAFFA